VSIELEVRSDDGYSRTASRDTITTLLVRDWGVTRQSDDLFVCRKDGCLVEVDLGRPDAPADKADALQWVGFRVPAGAKLASAEKSLQMAIAVAEHVGWRVFDPQQGRYVDPADLLPGLPLRQEVFGLFREVHAEGFLGFLGRLARRARRQSLRSIAECVGAGVVVAAIVARLFGFTLESNGPLLSSIAASLSGALLAGDIVLDVLGDVHQEAGAKRKVLGRTK
jgi:hypothetical protein